MARLVRYSSRSLLIAAFCCTWFSVGARVVTAGSFHGARSEDNPALKVAYDGVLPPQAHAYGKSYGEWGAAWWKWALSFPYATNPIFDATGQYGSQGQDQIPWFLAGNVGGTSDRSITIPNGRPLFFPLISFENDYPCPDPTFQPAPGQSLRDFLTAGVKPIIDMVDGLSADLDGVSIPNLRSYRATSGLDYFTGDPSLTSTFDACITGSRQAFVTDGYWLMLTPLPPGRHTLHFSSGISSFGFAVDVTYHVTVQVGHRMVGAASMSGDAAPAVAPTPVNGSWGRLKMLYR